MKAARLILCASLAWATVHAAPTARLPSEWFAPLDTDAGRFALVDKATGIVRFGTMTSGGIVTFPQVVPTGISAVSDVASGIVNPTGEEILLTAPAANRIMRVINTPSGAFASLFSPVVGIGLSGVSESETTASRRLIISSLANGAVPVRVEVRQSASGQLVSQATHSDPAVRLEPMTNPADGVRIGIGLVIRGTETEILVIEPPVNRRISDILTGSFDMITDVLGSAGGRHIVVFQKGSATAHILTAALPITKNSSFTKAIITLPFPVSVLLRVPCGGPSPLTDGLIALADDGSKAEWLRVSAAGNGVFPADHTFTPDSGVALTGLLPLASGVVQLSGTQAGAVASSFKGMTFDGSNWVVRSSGGLPSLPGAGTTAATLLFLNTVPEESPGAQVIGMQNAPDWTRRTDASPTPASVVRESFVSSTSGLRFTTTQGLIPPVGTSFVVTNQVDPAMSVSVLGGAEAPFTPSLAIEPPSGSFEESFQVTASFDSSAYKLLFRRDAGEWKDWPGTLPVAYTTTLQFTLVNLTGTPNSGPVQTRSYLFTANKLTSQDSDGDGVPDFVELALGLDPFSGPDGDGDGVSDLDEIVKGSSSGADAADATVQPTLDDSDRDLQGRLITSNDHVLRAAGLRIAGTAQDFEIQNIFSNQEMQLRSMDGALLDMQPVARFNPPFPALPDNLTTGARLQTSLGRV